MFEVSKSFSFEAAHSLPHLPDGHKCRNIHGHSYRFEVVCRGYLDERDFVVDYSEISKEAKVIVEALDHKNLNDLFEFKTTAENLCRWIYQQLRLVLPVYQVRLYETATTCVTYPVK